ncbi:MAG: hypothetical protein U0935_15135 [Pirellulales bacterium]
MKRSSALILTLALAGMAHDVRAIDSDQTPRPIPLTRPEMKQYLEDMKDRKPRIPLPELTDEDRAKLGERGDSYESRLRYHYLPGGDTGRTAPAGGNAAGAMRRVEEVGRLGGFGFAGGGREADSDMTLDYAFKTQLFWIVSRTNNCQYCLGHQESKLLAAGMQEDEIAALDSDWSRFSPAQQAAYAYARKLTFEPQQIGDADIQGLRTHFTDKQILEMTLSIAGNNAINRWKEGAGIPQSSNGGNFGTRRPGEAAPTEKTERPTARHSYLTPTSPQFASAVTKVAPVVADPATGEPARQTVFRRAPLEPRAQAEAALKVASQRAPRLPVADEATTRPLLPEQFPAGAVPQWARLLATFPNSAKTRISGVMAAETRGDLSPLVKAQVSWIIARQDRAWYAAAQARRRLQELGWNDDQIFALDGDGSEFTPAERAIFTVARKLSATPVVLTDADVTAAVQQIGPRDVVQLISYTTHRVSFDRVTEAAGLTAE